MRSAREVEDIIFRSDTEHALAVLGDDEEYNALYHEDDHPEELPPAEGTVPPPSGQKGTQTPQSPESAENVGITAEELTVLKKYGLVDDAGLVRGKYKTVDDFLRADDLRNKIVSARVDTLMQDHPDAVAEFMRERGLQIPAGGETPSLEPTPPLYGTSTGVEHPSADLPDMQPTIASVEQWLDSDPTLNLNVETRLLQEFGDELTEIGMYSIPKTKEEWRALRNLDNGLYADMRIYEQRLEDERVKMRTFGVQMLQAVARRNNEKPEYENGLRTSELEELKNTYGIDSASEPIQLRLAELELLRTPNGQFDNRYYEDDWRTGVPVLRKGAISAYLLATEPQALIRSAAAKQIADQDAARNAHYDERRNRVSLFPPSASGATSPGGSTRRAPGTGITPEQWNDDRWREEFAVRDPDGYEAQRDYIDALPSDERQKWQ